VKNFIQSSNTKKSLNLKLALNSRVLKQFQSADFSYSALASLMRATLFTTLALGLICSPYHLAYAEENPITSNQQSLAESYAQELGDVLAQDHWTRIQFSSTYDDPVVVVEGSTANGNNSYVVGIRNVDAMGFEVSLKNCDSAAGIPVQENVRYSVIEKSQLPSTEGANSEVRQQFSWGECTTAADITTS
jgi:hypothetical protein